MRKQILVLSLILLSLLFSGCGDQSTDSSIEDVPELSTLIQQGDYLEQRVRQGYILGSSSDRDRDGMEKLISDTKMALNLLKDRYKRKNAIKFIAQKINHYREMQIIAQDKFYTDKFFDDVSVIVTRLSKKHNIPIYLTWNLYRYNFFKGISPFDTYGSSSPWIWYHSTSKTAAEIRNNKADNQALLLSPTFDISSLKQITLKAKTFIDITQKSPTNFNLAKIKSTVFKIYASSSYIGEVPTDLTSKQWVEIPMTNLIRGNNNIKLNLEQFVGEDKLTIVFYFNADTKIVGKNNFKWQILDIAIQSDGETLSFTSRFEPSFSYTFNNIDQLSEFTLKNFLSETSNWNLKERYGYFVEQRSNSKSSQNDWIISKEINISKVKKPILRLKETINTRVKADIFQTLKETLKIKISNNFSAENIEGSRWCELSHVPSSIVGNSWVDIAPMIDLSSCLQDLGANTEQINIAFQFVNESTDDAPTEQTTWQIKEFSIFDHQLSNNE